MYLKFIDEETDKIIDTANNCEFLPDSSENDYIFINSAGYWVSHREFHFKDGWLKEVHVFVTKDESEDV